MKRYIWLFLALLLIIPLSLNAQAFKRYDGGLIRNGTIDSDAYKDGSIDNEHLSATAVDGGVCLEATQVVGWFPVDFDSSSTSGDVFGAGGWVLDGTYPPVPTYKFGRKVFGFDADVGGTTGDDKCYLDFIIPFDYEADGLEIYLYWFHTDADGGATDSVEWDLSMISMGNADTLLWASDSAFAVVYDVATARDSSLYIVNIDPETSINSDDITYTYGDLIRLAIWVDENGPRANGLDSGELAYLVGVLITAEKRDD